MALLPTKKITALPSYTAPLTGNELFESVQTGTSVQVPSRAFVLPTDSIITVSSMGGSLPGSRQLVPLIGIAFVDGGPGSTLGIAATGAVAGPADPTALVGLSTVNGVALTYMRSDAAPALDQSIAPTWTGNHIFASNQNQVRNALPQWIFVETDAAADNQAWPIRVSGEQFNIGALNDLGSVFTPWVTVDRTTTVIDLVNLQGTTVAVNGQNIRDAAILTSGTVATARLASGVADATTWLRGDQTWQGLPGGFTGFANPTATIGLAAVNGVATTAMRSDAAPPLSQAIVPTWTGRHTFTGVALASLNGYAVNLNSAAPGIQFNESDAAVNNRLWAFLVTAEQMQFRVDDDAFGASTVWMQVDRTGAVVDAIALVSTTLTWNGNPLLSTATAFANPTATIGLAVVNGVATTAMRSDAAPALSQAIAPTWTALHVFARSDGPGFEISRSNNTGFRWNQTGAAANNRLWDATAVSEQLLFRTLSDDAVTTVNWMQVDRTATVVDQVGFPNGVVRVGNNQTEAFTNTASQFRIAVDGAAQLGMRNCNSDIELYLGLDSSGLFFGTVTAHPIKIFTNSTHRFSFTDAALNTGGATPTLSANKPGANAGVVNWMPVTSPAGTQMWIPCFGN